MRLFIIISILIHTSILYGQSDEEFLFNEIVECLINDGSLIFDKPQIRFKCEIKTGDHFYDSVIVVMNEAKFRTREIIYFMDGEVNSKLEITNSMIGDTTSLSFIKKTKLFPVSSGATSKKVVLKLYNYNEFNQLASMRIKYYDNSAFDILFGYDNVTMKINSVLINHDLNNGEIIVTKYILSD